MTRKATIRILDEVYMSVVGLHPDDMSFLYDKYAKMAPNYFFNPKFTMGAWDGKIRYFHKDGKTYLYLIEDMLPKIYAMGYEVELVDLRTSSPVHVPIIDKNIFSHVLHPLSHTAIELRPYQVDGVNQLIENGNGIIEAATGAGKTFITAAISKQYSDAGLKTLTVVPTTDLVIDTYNDYMMCGLDTGMYCGSTKDLDHANIVSTWQALQNNPHIMQNFQVVTTDECHGVKGAVLRELLIDHGGHIMYRFGVTGTMPPEPSDHMLVLCTLGPVRYNISARQLINAGVLAEIHIDVITLEEDLTFHYEQFLSEHRGISKPPTPIQFKDGFFPDFTSEKLYLCRNEQRIEFITQLIETNADSRPGNVLCLVDSIPLGRALASLIPNSLFINGKDVKTPAARKKIYDLFETRNDLIVFATVHIAGTGKNIPRIFTLFLIDVGKSFIRVVQGIGRGLRKSHDKDNVLVVDISSDLKYSKKHSTERIKIYKTAEYPYKKHKVNYKKFFDSQGIT